MRLGTSWSMDNGFGSYGICLLATIGCSASPDASDSASPPGGIDGALIQHLGAAEVGACPNGGVMLGEGIDSNRNGRLDIDEFTATANVCNGENADPCSVASNGDGTHTITCPDGSASTVRDGASTSQSPGTDLRVFAGGEPIGRLYIAPSTPGSIGVYDEVLGIVFYVNPETGFTTSFYSPYYESVDCSGDPVVVTSTYNCNPDGTATNGLGRSIYSSNFGGWKKADQIYVSGVARLGTYRSFHGGGDPADCRGVGGGVEGCLVRLEPTNDVPTSFALPIEIR